MQTIYKQQNCYKQRNHKQQNQYKHLRFLETSAKEADNVEKLFHDIAKQLIGQTNANRISFYDEEGGSGIGLNKSQVGSYGLSTCCSKLN